MKNAHPHVVPLVLGISGLIPFIGTLTLFWINPTEQLLIWFINYAVVILAFIGATHWGLALVINGKKKFREMLYILSTVPAMIGWVATTLSHLPSLLLLVPAYIVSLLIDWRVSTQIILPSYYLKMRVYLTGTVILLIILMITVT